MSRKLGIWIGLAALAAFGAPAWGQSNPHVYLIHGIRNDGTVWENTAVKNAMFSFGAASVQNPTLGWTFFVPYQADVLNDQIDANPAITGQDVVAIGYSMGGVTAREAFRQRVATGAPPRYGALISIMSMHQGARLGNILGGRPQNEVRDFLALIADAFLGDGYLSLNAEGLPVYHYDTPTGRDLAWTALDIIGYLFLFDTIYAGSTLDYSVGSPVIAGINANTAESGIHRAGVIGVEDSREIYRLFGRGAGVISEQDFLDAVDWVKGYLVFLIVNDILDLPESCFESMGHMRRMVAKFSVLEKAPTRWKRLIDADGQGTDAIVSQATQTFPGAPLNLIAYGANHLEVANHPNVVSALRTIFQTYGLGHGCQFDPVFTTWTATRTDVYWGESATITAVAQRDNCPINYVWLAQGPPDNYTVYSTGGVATAYNDGVSAYRSVLVTCHAHTAGGLASKAIYITFRTGSRPSGGGGGGGGGGGCPYVGGLTADGYQLENNILPQVEEGDPGGDRADWYKLQEKLVETEGTYRLRIAEFENEHSRLDEIRLMSVDHPQGTRLFVSDGGQMDLVVPSPDDLEIQAPRKGGTADAAVWRIEAKESFTMLRKAAAGASAKSDPMNVVIGKGIGRFKPRINYRSERAPAQPLVARFRERPTEVLLPLELARGEAVALEAQQPFALLGAELALRVGIRPESSDLRMLSAFGPDGACTEQVAALDGSVAELSPGQSIDLEFEATPVPIGMERSFVVMSSGRYEKIEEAAAPAPPAPRPQLRFSAGASAASGDALRLEYETATGGQVRIALYDLQGREIEVSEEGDREAGVHRSAWTPRPLPPAIYFARLSVRAPDGGQFVSDPIRIVRTR